MYNSFTGSLSSDQKVGERHNNLDEDLYFIDQIRQGNIDAFDPIVKKYKERIYSVIYNMTSNSEDAEDLAQETFVKAFRSISKFKGKSSFYTWLYRIGINLTLAYLRRNKFRRFFSFNKLEDTDGTLLDRISSSDRSDQKTLATELQEKLNEAIQDLPEKQRIVLVMHEIEQISLKKISEILKISSGTARSRLHYAKESLHEPLKPFIH